MEQFWRALRVDRFLLDCAIATGDAAKTAMASTISGIIIGSDERPSISP